ncbi:MAG: hypothetical protein OEY41_10120 [Acidimicrobiia bacterium]|nr:hypothetical protein [Acidimicrobiia bacterium]
MKRVISGLFLLLALGALGFILAGALKSGEQLIVRFLTAIIVAALGLYVISDLRLQADDSAVAKGEKSAGGRANPASEAAGPQSTAAYMATVTRRAPAADSSASTSVTDLTADVLSLGGSSSGRDGATSDVPMYRAGAHSRGRPEVVKADERMQRASTRSIEAEIDDSLTPEYQLQDDEVRHWPLTAEHPVVKLPAPAGVEGTDRTGAGSDADNDRDCPEGDITRPLATRRLAAILAEANDEDEADDDAVPHRVPSAFDTGEIEKLVDQLAVGGPVPAPVSSSPFGRMSAPSGGLVLLERPPVDTATPATAPAAAARAENPLASPVATPAPIKAPVAPAIGTPETPASGAAVAASAPLRPTRPAMPAPISSTLAAADYTRAPLAGVVSLRRRPIAPRNEIEAAIRSGELEVIASLIDQGLLSTEGPISDRDVRTMVYVAFTSSELRKILLAGGTLDGDNSNIDLGEVDVFYQPALAGGSSLSQSPVEPAGDEPATAPALPVEVIDLRDAEPARARAL